MQSLEESDTLFVDHILDVVDDMSGSKQPKVLLFDIGGVCVVSPFQSILDYELSLDIPPGWVNYSISKTSPTGFWHRLETGSIAMDTAFFEGFGKDLNDQDPWMFPALKKLQASGKYIIAALSNTVIFQPGHKLWKKDFMDDPVRTIFDVFISSAHVGLRKPDPKIYQLALKRLNEYAAENADTERGRALGWGGGIKSADVLFLDDIGENLKAARKQGFGTIKVHLGRTYEAVEELEKITGLALEGDHPKIPVKPRIKGSDKAKL
ncbi:Acyl-CoA dehydrogenase family member 10 [Colletotrichum orbiculare MAFF 240422]|uniref:Acyl-CoA dehydrogenase family member 10 n=1 Tax=Colletotrichum orbiculare (strain 104-T / ATCC 96160 / CBS 514.97 / LARS 414 / MAFF 240422) TaxID=1213857 RepID=A0A484F7X6_COLOR|nr:Acyl-CoA dehydrogenase family member 10 [Colletotrichum orbiculare MAFF 240422]